MYVYIILYYVYTEVILSFKIYAVQDLDRY